MLKKHSSTGSIFCYFMPCCNVSIVTLDEFDITSLVYSKTVKENSRTCCTFASFPHFFFYENDFMIKHIMFISYTSQH